MVLYTDVSVLHTSSLCVAFYVFNFLPKSWILHSAVNSASIALLLKACCCTVTNSTSVLYFSIESCSHWLNVDSSETSAIYWWHIPWMGLSSNDGSFSCLSSIFHCLRHSQSTSSYTLNSFHVLIAIKILNIFYIFSWKLYCCS